MALTVWNDKTVSGQYAGLVAANWKGQTYIRSAPSKVNNNSPKQKNHKSLYKSLYEFISPCYKDGIKPFFQSKKMTPANIIVKAQNPKYWKQTNDTIQEKINARQTVTFPISELQINVTLTYEWQDYIFRKLKIKTFNNLTVQMLKME